MYLLRFRALFGAGLSASLLCGLAVAETSGATISDTDAEASIATMSETLSETTVATTPDTAAESSAPATPESAAVEILPPDEPWGGLTRGEWDARSWQWVLSLPEDINPWFDTTGERCGYGQSGPVSFSRGAGRATRSRVWSPRARRSV